MSVTTARDQRLLETLGAFGMLATRQIGDLIFPGIRKTTICRRLRRLENEDKIRRFQGLPDGSLMWALTASSTSALGVEARVKRANRNTLEHDMILADVRIALSKSGLVTNWIAEHELKHEAAKANYRPYTKIEHVPDAVVTMEIQGDFKAVALELERRVKSKARYKELFLNYIGDVPFWTVWYLVSNQRIGERIEKIWNAQAAGLSKAQFIWSTIPDFLKNFPNVTLHMKDGTYPLTTVLTP